MLERLKSLPLTIILTILVWMYAEAQFTTTREGVALTLHIASPAKDLSVRAFDTADNAFHSALTIHVTVQGAQSAVEKFYQQSLGTVVPQDDFANLILVPSGLQPGVEQSLDTLTVLNNMVYFKHNGLAVTAANPPQIRLSVDRLVTVPRPITFRATAAPAEVVSISPSTANVTLPQWLLTQIGGPDHISIFATPLSNPADIAPTAPVAIPARLLAEYPPPNHDDLITISPTQVAVTVRVPQQHEAVRQFDAVRVDVSGPPDLLRDNTVDLQPATVHVTVAGPPAALAALTPTVLHAILELTPDDHPTADPQSRNLRYLFPDGIQFRAGDPQIRFRLVPRPSTHE